MRLPIIRFLISYQGPDYQQAPYAQSFDAFRSRSPPFWPSAIVTAARRLRRLRAGMPKRVATALAVSVTAPRAEQFARTVVATGSVYRVAGSDHRPRSRRLSRSRRERRCGRQGAQGPGARAARGRDADGGSRIEEGREGAGRCAAHHRRIESAPRGIHPRRPAPYRIRSTSACGAKQLAAQARVEAAASDLESSELKLRYTRVVAPDDGVVTARTVVVGQIAQAGGEMLRVLRQSRVEWRAEVPEAPHARDQGGPGCSHHHGGWHAARRQSARGGAHSAEWHAHRARLRGSAEVGQRAPRHVRAR